MRSILSALVFSAGKNKKEEFLPAFGFLSR
jgi:hypothetical protein